MIAYYNEIDPDVCQWLENLIKAGHIAPGHVDNTTSIDQDVEMAFRIADAMINFEEQGK